MKRKLTTVLICVYIITVVGFNAFGGFIRGLLSPEVSCGIISSMLSDGGIYLVLPEGALQKSSDGREYVYTVQSETKYREKSHLARLRYVESVYIDGKACIKMNSGFEKIIINPPDSITDGTMINVSD